jgi:hypothetical protein
VNIIFHCILKIRTSHDSSVVVAARLLNGRSSSRALIPGRDKRIFFSPLRLDRLWGPPSLPLQWVLLPVSPGGSLWRNAYVIKYRAALTCVLLLSQKATYNIRIYSPLTLCQKPEAQKRPYGSMLLETTFNSHPPSQPISVQSTSG